MNNGLRCLLVYACFAILALLCAFTVLQMDVKFAHPSQKEALQPKSLLPILALGCTGSWLWGYAGKGCAPSSRLQWLKLAGIGAGFGVFVVLIDWGFGFSQMFAERLGISSIHIAFPASALAYTAGAVVVETLYRIIPIPIMLWIISRLMLRGKGMTRTFWVLAVLTSLIEPVSQAGLLFGSPLALISIGVLIFGFNITEAWLMWNYGVASPIVARIVFYLIWHVTLGPVVINHS